MKNPNWQRDELILALDLYFELDNKNVDKTNSKIIELSELLNKLPIHESKENETFRNPSGVAMKLSNLKRFDTSYSGKGLERGGKLEEVVWNEFITDKIRLKTIAFNIKNIINSTLLSQLSSIEDDSTFDNGIQEGSTIYKLHKLYERNSLIVKRKKQQYQKKFGKLDCEICKFDFFKTYGEIGIGFIECHHIKPLYKLNGTNTTHMEDLILVCSNCHRMLHRKLNGTITHENLKYVLTHGYLA